MQNVNFSALWGTSQGRDEEENSSFTYSAKQREGTPTDDDAKGDVEEPVTKLNRPPRVPLDPRVSLEGDGTPLKSYVQALFYPEVYMKIFYALRITLLVAFPLALLARHPSVNYKFPAHVVLPLWGIVDCRYHIGEQIAASIVSYQCGIWMGVWGTINNVWNLRYHHSAWWCAILAVGFVMFLFGDVRGKRLFVLQGILILQMEYLPGGTALDYPIKVGKDMILATTFAMLQVWLPPRSNARQCDESLAKCWNFIDHIVKNALRVCWTDDPIECALCMNELTTEPFQNLINIIPGQMNFIMYEFWESTLRLELRKERFEHIKTCNPFLHALTDSARSMMVRRLQGMKVVRQPETEPPRQKKDNPLLDSEEEYSTNSREPFAWTRSQSSFVGPAAKTRPSIVTNREQVFRSQADTELWRRSRELLSHSVDNYLFCLKDVTTALGKYLNPKDVATKVPFDALRDAAENLYQDLNKMHFEILIKGNKAVSPFVYSHTVFFHVTLISLAEHLFQYGEKMRNFDRSNYKSQWRRMWEFFFYDHWSRFWEDLPKRLTLATPRDVRIVKDAIKMFCAYGIGAVYTQYTDVENAYYFGMAILIGVGQPTAGDTMIASVYRITGMVCACSIAYIAVWHTNNLAGELAISLAGVFIAALFRDVQLYAHTAQYCSMLICTALNSAGTKLTLLSRIVSNTFTVMTYYVICVFIFPIDVLRVTDAAKVKALGVVLDRFSGLVDIATQPVVLESDDDDDDDEDDSGSASFHGDGKSKMTIERHENKVFIRQYTQERLEALRLSRTPMWVAVHAFGMWMMKAAAEPTSHGNAYPLDDMKNVYSSLKRLASATDVLHAGLTTLCRPRVTGTGSQHHHHKAVRGMMRSVLKVTVSIDAHVRIMIQDFIDAMAIPLQWNMERATVHFTEFLAISADLHSSFDKAHRRYVKAMRKDFRTKVKQRAVTAAANSFQLQPDVVQQLVNESFANHNAGSSSNLTSTKDTNLSFSHPDQTSSDDEPEEHYRTDAVADEVANTITNASFAAVAADNNPNKSSNSPFNEGAGQRTAQQGKVKQVVLPFAELAENEEYINFVSNNRTFVQNLKPEEYTLSHDVNMIISMLVATDMFFGESERLLKTMYSVNRYAKSRMAHPVNSWRDIVDM